MSFWGGVAKGFEAGEAKREREEVRKVAADRNELQDKRWQMQWDQSQETILYNKDRNTQADKLAAEALEYAKGRNTQADTLAAEALSIARNKEIINALKASGTTGSTTGKRNTVATAKEIQKASIDLNLALGGVEGLSALPDDQKEFYTSTLADPSATMQLVAFAKVNKINLNDVHSYMEIGAVVASQGAEGMAKLKAQIADGTLNLTGENAAEDFMKTFKTIAEYVPGYTQLTQTSQIRDLSKDKLAYEAVVKNMNAYLGQDLAKLKASGGDSSALQQLYNDLTSSNETTQAAAMGVLFNRYGGSVSPELLQEGNSFLTPYLSATGSSEPLNFDTKEEAEIFFDSGNTVPSFTVGGLPELYYPTALTGENPPKVQVETPVAVGEATSDTTATPTGTAATVDVFKDRDGNIASYGELFRGMQSLPEDQRAAYAKQFIELENDPALADFASIAQNFSDDAAGRVYGGAMWALGAYTAGVAKVGNFLTGDTARATRIALNANQQKTKAKEIMAEGIVEHLQELADKNNVQGSFGPGRAEAIKKGLLKSNTLDIPAQEVWAAQNPMGYADSPRLSELLSNVPEEVQQAAASILTRGDQKDIDQANEELSKEFGQEAADALLRQKDTNRRIAEEDMAMARPVPQPLSDIVIPIKPSDPALDDTNRRIAEEDMAMAVPVPQSWGDLPIKSLPRPKDESDSGLLARISELAAANDEEKAKLLGQKPFSDGLMGSPRIKNTKAGQLLSEIIALATANDDEKAELLGQKPFSDNVMPKRKKKKLKKGVATERNQAEAVLQKHGFNILNFLRSEGFTSEDTEEDIAEGLADWYSNNSEDLSIKSPPMDVGPVTYVLKIMLDKGE